MSRLATALIVLLLSAPTLSGRGYQLKLPPSQRFELANGLQALIVEDASLPMVSMTLRLDAGSLRDPPGQAGLAALCARVLTAGAGSPGAPPPDRRMAAMGGNASARAWQDATDILVEVPAEHWLEGLELLADLALRPTLGLAAIVQTRGQLELERELRSQSPEAQVGEALRGLIYGEHPLGRPPSGTRASLAALSPAAVQGFHQRHYVARGAALVLIGPLGADRVLPELVARLGKMPAGEPRVPLDGPKPTGDPTRVLLIDRPELDRVVFAMGHPGPARTDPDALASQLAVEVLGGGEGSRLATRLEDLLDGQEAPYARLSNLAAPGPLMIRGSCPPARLRQVIDATLAELEALRRRVPKRAELEAARARRLGRYPLELEPPAGLALALLRAHPGPLLAEPVETLPQALQKVSGSDLQRAASTRLSPGAMRYVLIGPADQLLDQLEGLGEVERLATRP